MCTQIRNMAANNNQLTFTHGSITVTADNYSNIQNVEIHKETDGNATFFGLKVFERDGTVVCDPQSNFEAPTNKVPREGGAPLINAVSLHLSPPSEEFMTNVQPKISENVGTINRLSVAMNKEVGDGLVKWFVLGRDNFTNGTSEKYVSVMFSNGHTIPLKVIEMAIPGYGGMKAMFEVMATQDAIVARADAAASAERDD